MIERHIHGTMMGQSCMHTVPRDRSSIEVTTISQFSGKHIRIPDITPVIQYTIYIYCFHYCCSKSELCALILIDCWGIFKQHMDSIIKSPFTQIKHFHHVTLLKRSNLHNYRYCHRKREDILCNASVYWWQSFQFPERFT